MTPFEHSLLSIRKFGGEVDWYLPVHSFLDSSKLFYPNFKHRLLLHNTTLGLTLAEKKFGEAINNVPVKYICIEHFKEDLSNIVPSLMDWYNIVETNYSYEEFLNIITNSDFGFYCGLCDKAQYSIEEFLNELKLKTIWQPLKSDLIWLNNIMRDCQSIDEMVSKIKN